MKLLLDQNLSYKLVQLLESVYPGSAHVRELNLETEDDLVVWQYAKDNGFVIVTKDIDFFEISLMKGHPPKIVWLRIGNVPTLTIQEILIGKKAEVEAFQADGHLACLEIV